MINIKTVGKKTLLPETQIILFLPTKCVCYKPLLVECKLRVSTLMYSTYVLTQQTDTVSQNRQTAKHTLKDRKDVFLPHV